MHRRDLLKAGAMTALAAALRPLHASAATAPDEPAIPPPFFSTNDVQWQSAYDRALSILAANVQVLPRFAGPVLIEGADYAGIWQECGPHESLVYRRFRPDAARNSHMTFFALQRADGQLPANNRRNEVGFGQIQMVVPIAATAWELAQATGDDELLATAYRAGAQWDAWLMRYRNTRGTGLIEGFCTYDTGMDNSPRWAGLVPQCPDKDARRCPPNPTLPRLCPDLSATVYGARVALSAMAAALGKSSEAAQWRESAETLRSLILTRLYSPDDGCFYDLDAQNKFVRVRSDILTRVCGEHVVDAKTFAAMWDRQLGNPQAFWPAFPFPSIALDDPTFVRPIPANSWGGASQALTALRAARWLDHYGRSAEHAHLMQQWCAALVRDGTFRQQLDPLTGDFTPGGQPSYSPAALMLYDSTWRLAGIVEEANELHWNVRPGHAASNGAVFRLQSHSRQMEMHYTGTSATLTLNQRPLGTVEGIARLVTDHDGKPLYARSIDQRPQPVVLRLAGQPQRRFVLKRDERQSFAGEAGS
jgi:hypothetical protein